MNEVEITPELAVRLIERGLNLPLNRGPYTQPRLREIAERMETLEQERKSLIAEIYEIAAGIS